MKSQANRDKKNKDTSWDALADWYDGWVGEKGSRNHRELAIPAVLDLLRLKSGEAVLDVGAGQGVLAPYVAEGGAVYLGVDISARMIEHAQKRHGEQGAFIVGDARHLPRIDGLEAGTFDAAVFLLSIQDMDPLDEVVRSAAWALKPGGCIVMVMTHPCFRAPRQSGWGWDEGRKLRYRRVDRYLTPLAVPLKQYPGRKRGVSRSFHRPLSAYVNALGEEGMWVEKMVEVPSTLKQHRGKRAKARRRADEEFPLFLGLRARKVA